jgi:hypothetical protein
MEVRRRLLDAGDANDLRQLGVEGADDRTRVLTEGHADARDLAEGVDSSISAAGAMHLHRSALEPRQRVLEQALNGRPLRLPLPADKLRPVIGKGQLERSHQAQS